MSGLAIELRRFIRPAALPFGLLLIFSFPSSSQTVRYEPGKPLHSAGSALQPAVTRGVKTRILPDYPDIASRMGLVGIVQLQAVVRPDGTVKQVYVVGGHPILVIAAKDALMRWRYEPAAKETVELVRVVFSRD